jgi:hypothetical protein
MELFQQSPKIDLGYSLKKLCKKVVMVSYGNRFKNTFYMFKPNTLLSAANNTKNLYKIRLQIDALTIGIPPLMREEFRCPSRGALLEQKLTYRALCVGAPFHYLLFLFLPFFFRQKITENLGPRS